MRWQWLVGNQRICGYLQHTGPLKEQVLLQIRPFLEDCMILKPEEVFPETWRDALFFGKNKTSPPPYTHTHPQ